MREEIQFSIFLVNKPGVLASITTALARARIDLVALTLVDSVEHGVMRIVTDNAQATREVLSHTQDRWTESLVLMMELANRPGAFARVAQKLADAHINIGYAYCTGGAAGGKTVAVFKVADIKKAMKLFPEQTATAKAKKRARTVRASRGRGPKR